MYYFFFPKVALCTGILYTSLYKIYQKNVQEKSYDDSGKTTLSPPPRDTFCGYCILYRYSTVYGNIHIKVMFVILLLSCQVVILCYCGHMSRGWMPHILTGLDLGAVDQAVYPHFLRTFRPGKQRTQLLSCGAEPAGDQLYICGSGSYYIHRSRLWEKNVLAGALSRRTTTTKIASPLS